MRTAIGFTLLLLCSGALRAETGAPPAGEDLPSAALLEFLGELEPLDDETWSLLEENAQKDVAERKRGNPQ